MRRQGAPVTDRVRPAARRYFDPEPPGWGGR